MSLSRFSRKARVNTKINRGRHFVEWGASHCMTLYALIICRCFGDKMTTMAEVHQWESETTASTDELERKTRKVSSTKIQVGGDSVKQQMWGLRRVPLMRMCCWERRQGQCRMLMEDQVVGFDWSGFREKKENYSFAVGVRGGKNDNPGLGLQCDQTCVINSGRFVQRDGDGCVLKLHGDESS